MNGLLSYGTYLPYWRLQRNQIALALGEAGGKGSRTVASYDEDSTSMGVEASRVALRRSSAHSSAPSVLFATTSPAYRDKTNATAIHAALGLDSSSAAWDLVGSVRSASGAIRLGSDADTRLVVMADTRSGLPGGPDESSGGDGAAALLFGEGECIADTLGWAHASSEFLDRWSPPGSTTAAVWEERFGEDFYIGLAQQALSEALKDADVLPEEVHTLIVTGLHGRAVKRVAAMSGINNVADDLTLEIGNTGAAHAGIVLANVLDAAAPDQTIVVLVLADGCDAWVLRTTPLLAEFNRSITVRSQIDSGNDNLPYTSFLTWRGFLKREPARRPDPERPAGPPSARSEHWKFGFTGSTCIAVMEDASFCNTRHLPPARVCVRCAAVDQMTPENLADVKATIATFTVDRLAFSLSPPTVVAVIDFDGGGRFQCELTDEDPLQIGIGDRVEMTFRRLFTSGDIHNYFWKARPVRNVGGEQ